MNKYSQLLKKLGLSAAALALSATLAVDSASAADENATDETVEQNVEADTTTEEKATEATTEEAVEEKAPEATQPEQTDRLYGRTPVPHVNYDHAYFTHKTSKTGNSEWAYVSFYINGFPYSQTSHNVSSDGKIHGSITYDDLRDLVEEQVKGYDNGVVLDKLDENPYDNYYSYYFVDADKLSTDGETPEKPAADKQAEQKPAAGKQAEQKPAAGKKEEQKPAAGKQAEQKPEAGKQAEQKPAAGKKEEQKPAAGKQAEQKPEAGKQEEKKPEAGKQAEQKPEAGKQAEQKPATPAKEKPAADKKQGSVQSDKQDPKLVATRKDLLARVEASDLTEGAKKQLIEVINGLKLENVGGAETAFYHYQKRHYEEVKRQKQEAGKKDSASKAKANQHDSKWGAFGTEENATRYAVGEFYGNGFKELTNLTQAQRNEIEERLGAAKTLAEFEAIVADAKRMNSGQLQSNQGQSGQAQAQKQEARGERLPDTATGAWALGAVGLSTILAGLGVKKFKKD